MRFLLSQPISCFIANTLLLLLLSGCGGGSSSGTNQFPDATSETPADPPKRLYPETPLSCDLSDMRQWVNANMHDYYLFYNQVPILELDAYGSIEQLIHDMRVKPNDRFSYISDAEQSEAQFSFGLLFGFGQSMVVEQGIDGTRRIRISLVETNSPFASVGVQRGDYLLTVNGKDPFTLSASEIESLYGQGAQSVEMMFTVLDKNNLERSFTLSSTEYEAQTVSATRVIESGDITIGYLAFNSFLETSKVELDDAFSAFAQSNISELVLDLRYNRGGRVSVANKLASQIAGRAAKGNFVTVALNDKYTSENQSIPFLSEPLALDLTRVIVLTTASSCSASELVINGLRPFLDVVVIGEPSCGKPYGSLGRIACGKQMNALEYEFVNDSNSGGYYNGIEVDCTAADDLSRALGDTQENMLATALTYLATAQCPMLLAARDRKTLPRVSTWHNIHPAMSDISGSMLQESH